MGAQETLAPAPENLPNIEYGHDGFMVAAWVMQESIDQETVLMNAMMEESGVQIYPRQEPSLVAWRDNNSYANDIDLSGHRSEGNSYEDAAKKLILGAAHFSMYGDWLETPEGMDPLAVRVDYVGDIPFQKHSPDESDKGVQPLFFVQLDSRFTELKQRLDLLIRARDMIEDPEGDGDGWASETEKAVKQAFAEFTSKHFSNSK